MILLEPLEAKHLQDFPIPEFPLDYWRGKALVMVDNGRFLGICGASREGDVATVGMILTPEARKHGVLLTRFVLRGLAGLRHQGIKYVRARAEADNGVNWLKRLGFARDDGWWVKCLA